MCFVFTKQSTSFIYPDDFVLPFIFETFTCLIFYQLRRRLLSGKLKGTGKALSNLKKRKSKTQNDEDDSDSEVDIEDLDDDVDDNDIHQTDDSPAPVLADEVCVS